MSRARDLGSSINFITAGKNLIINGAMDFWQRGTSSSAAGSQFVADRWNTYRGGYQTGLTVSRQLVGDTTNLPGIQYCMRLQRDSGNTATQGIGMAHNIESINSLPLAGKTVTLSFWARAGATFISSGAFIRPLILSGTGTDEACRNGLSNMTYVTFPTVLPTASWVRYSVTGNVPNNATQVCISIDGNVFGTAGATDYYEVTGVQLEIGSSATAFSRSGGDIEGEFAKCQRYYSRLSGTSGSGYSVFGVGYSYSSTIGLILVNLPVTMRTMPNLVDVGLHSYALYNSNGSRSLISIALNQGNRNQVWLQYNITGGVQGEAAFAQDNNGSGYLGFSAEL